MDDFKDLKSEYKEVLDFLNNELMDVNGRLLNCDTEEYQLCESSVFEIYKNQERVRVPSGCSKSI